VVTYLVKSNRILGMVNNRVQCVLHDRGINAEEAAENINGSLSWIRNIRKADEKVDLNEKKYPTGLDCNKTFYKGDILDDFKNHIRSTVPGTYTKRKFEKSEILNNFENSC
jgi:hypothetical protein